MVNGGLKGVKDIEGVLKGVNRVLHGALNGMNRHLGGELGIYWGQ